ncbi:MAG: hypothetical protein JRE64_08025 [Deltaproteobacteria bacterium]|nr:hypothetical protein [Deltaproteobacteria bacterium]
MKVKTCKGCGTQWPINMTISECLKCGSKNIQIMELRSVDRKRLTSFEMVFNAYHQQDRKKRNIRPLTVPVGRPIGSIDVYPLILNELRYYLTKSNVEFILYGSAALWLEGCPRPDSGQVQTVKDLDMCTLEKNENIIIVLVKSMIAGRYINWGDENCVFKSNQGTMEFMSADQLIQFSFNLQTPKDYNKVKSISTMELIPNTNARIRCAGLKYIVEGLIGEDSMFRKTLFRSDKTRKILTYACLCLGYGVLNSKDIVNELVDRFAEAEWNEIKKQLSNISINRHDKTQTEYWSDVKPLIDKLNRIKSFKGDRQDYNKKIELDLLAALTYLDEQRSRDVRLKKINQQVEKELQNTILADEKLKNLKIALRRKIGKKVSAESDIQSFDLACDLLVQDAMRIWQGEVGTGILVFLMEELAVVHTIIYDCRWIQSGHKQKLLMGHKQLAWFILVEIDQRLEGASTKKSKKSLPSKKSSGVTTTGSRRLPPREHVPMTVEVGASVRIKYHLYYDVVGIVTKITGDNLVSVSITNCYEPRTIKPFRSDHTKIVLNTIMTWKWTPTLFAEHSI